MKKYTKPEVSIVELSVKESLSALPSNLSKVKKVAATSTYAATLFNVSDITPNATQG